MKILFLKLFSHVLKLSNKQIVQCKVVKYLKDAKIMQSMIFEDDINSKQYLKSMTAGNLPNLIPYSKALEVWRKNQELNNVHFGVSSCYLEVILSAMYRNPNDLSQKFAKIASDKGVSDYDYATASIRQICQYNSTFSALTFEDMNAMLDASLNTTSTGREQKTSPMEQITKF